MDSIKERAWIYELGLWIVVLIWGFNFSITKATLEHVHPFVFNALRFTCSTLLLGVMYLCEAEPGMKVGTFKFWSKLTAQLIGLSLFANVIYQLFFILGIDRTTSGNAALLIAGAPLWTVAIGHFMGLESLRSAAWIGLLISFLGTILLALVKGDVEFSQATLLGNLLCAGGAAGWGAYTALSKPFFKKFTPMALTFWLMVIALPFHWGFAAPYLSETDWAGLNRWIWVAILYSGLLSTGLAYGLWNVAVHHVGASHTAVYGYLVPVIAVISGAVTLSEPVTLAQVIGGLLVIGGLVLMRRYRTVAA